MIGPDASGGGRLGASPESSIEGRLPVVAAVILIIFTIFGLRLFQLQILQGEELSGIAKGNAVRLQRLEAARGEILDREGRVIASTRPAFGVSVTWSDLAQPARTLPALAMLLDAETGSLSERIGTPRGRKRFQPVVLAGDLSYDHRARVESHLYALPGVGTDVRPRRHYVEGDLSAHLLGTIGEIQREQLLDRDYAGYRAGEVIGQSGLEKLMEGHLRGRAGGRNVVVDVAGRVVEVLDERAPEPGGSVTLTLDLDLQRAAEEGFLPEVLGERPKMGAVVAMDPRNGEILALTSKPSFDPNDFAGGIDPETWGELTGDEWRPLQHRALAGQYPPGSTYKVVVAAAALADGVVSPQDLVFCPGHFRLGRRVYRCWKRGGHGAVNLRDALKRSCDVYFYHVGVQLGIDRIADFARDFGLGSKTGISIGDEQPGLVPTSAWKERRFKEPWMKGETVSAAIGQGFNLVTPLQLAVLYSAIANGGKVMEPRIVLHRQVPMGEEVEVTRPEVLARVPVPPEVLARIVDALTGVVEEQGGTGGRARVPGVRVAGKTGTAQVVRLKHTENLEDDEIPIRHRDHAWFAAMAPAEAPEIVVAVLVEHGGHGGSAAGPIAQRVLARYFEKQREAAGELLVEAVPEPVGDPLAARASPREVDPIVEVSPPLREVEPVVEVSPPLEVEPVAELSPPLEVEPVVEVSPPLEVEPVAEVPPPLEVEPVVEVSPPAELEPVFEVIPESEEGPVVRTRPVWGEQAPALPADGAPGDFLVEPSPGSVGEVPPASLGEDPIAPQVEDPELPPVEAPGQARIRSQRARVAAAGEAADAGR